MIVSKLLIKRRERSPVERHNNKKPNNIAHQSNITEEYETNRKIEPLYVPILEYRSLLAPQKDMLFSAKREQSISISYNEASCVCKKVIALTLSG